MFILKQLHFTAKHLKNNLKIYQIALRDPRTPAPARYLLQFAIRYAHFLFDIVPDFVPVIGKLDDAFFIPMLVSLAIKLIPKEVMEDARVRVIRQRRNKIRADHFRKKSHGEKA